MHMRASFLKQNKIIESHLACFTWQREAPISYPASAAKHADNNTANHKRFARAATFSAGEFWRANVEPPRPSAQTMSTFVSNLRARRVPWRSWNEWDAVRVSLYSSDEAARQFACDRVCRQFGLFAHLTTVSVTGSAPSLTHRWTE